MESNTVNGFVINRGLAGDLEALVRDGLDGCLEDSDTADALLRVLGCELGKVAWAHVLGEVMGRMRERETVDGAFVLTVTDDDVLMLAAERGVDLEA